jgi:hypothetical protein
MSEAAAGDFGRRTACGERATIEMRTATAIPESRNDNVKQLLATLFLATPALIAFLCAMELARGPRHFISGLWFFYEASRDLGFVGIAIAATISVAALVRRTASAVVTILMLSATAAAIAMLLRAARIFANRP